MDNSKNGSFQVDVFVNLYCYSEHLSLEKIGVNMIAL